MFGGLENLILHPAAHSKLHLLQTNKIHTSKSNSATWSCGTITQPMYTFTASHRMHLPWQRKFGGFWRSQSVLTEAKVNSPAALKLWWLHLLKQSEIKGKWSLSNIVSFNYCKLYLLMSHPNGSLSTRKVSANQHGMSKQRIIHVSAMREEFTCIKTPLSLKLFAGFVRFHQWRQMTFTER